MQKLDLKKLVDGVLVLRPVLHPLRRLDLSLVGTKGGNANIRAVLLDQPRLAQPAVPAALLAGKLDSIERVFLERERLAGH